MIAEPLEKGLGKVSNKKSIVTIFDHKYFKQKITF